MDRLDRIAIILSGLLSNPENSGSHKYYVPIAFELLDAIQEEELKRSKVLREKPNALRQQD
jgi:hypothetical protein